MRIYDRIKEMTLEEMAIHYSKLNEAVAYTEDIEILEEW